MLGTESRYRQITVDGRCGMWMRSQYRGLRNTSVLPNEAKVTIIIMWCILFASYFCHLFFCTEPYVSQVSYFEKKTFYFKYNISYRILLVTELRTKSKVLFQF